MKLEDEIKQTKFESDQQKAMLNVMVTNNWIVNQQTKFLKQYDLSPAQYNVLRILRGAKDKPMMLNDITSRMLDKMSNATRLVEKLKLKKLVTREMCETNRRQVDISITETGKSLLAEIDLALVEFSKQMLKISNKEASIISDILEKWRS